MKKKPLNQATREVILEAVLDHRFAKQKKDLDKESGKFGDMIYNELLDAKSRRQINFSPDHWFDTTTAIFAYIDGKNVRFVMSERRRKPYHWNASEHYGNVYLVSGTSPAATVIVAHWAKEEAYTQAYVSARAAVKATLQAFKYVEDLIQGWPEVKKFVPKDEAKAATMALAIPPKQLNEMLGLS